MKKFVLSLLVVLLAVASTTSADAQRRRRSRSRSRAAAAAPAAPAATPGAEAPAATPTPAPSGGPQRVDVGEAPSGTGPQRVDSEGMRTLRPTGHETEHVINGSSGSSGDGTTVVGAASRRR